MAKGSRGHDTQERPGQAGLILNGPVRTSLNTPHSTSATPRGDARAEPAGSIPLLLAIAGPTAAGKSAVAMALAERIGGEIVSVDSMQVYRGLDIGTSKPSIDEQRRIRHHLIDVVDLVEPFDAAEFARRAREAISEIQRRGRTPILCGGTGLYFKACLEGIGEAPPANATLRAELEATPLPELLRELEQRDPATLVRIDRKNRRRVVRSLEVVRLTGKPWSALRSAWNPKTGSDSRPWFFGLKRSPDEMRVRIDERIEAMFAAGLVEEVRTLLRHGLEQNRTAMQAIGYRQVVEHLRGERPLTDTIVSVKKRTRQYAKRQMTWFRRQFDLDWISISRADTTASISEQLLARCHNPAL